MLVFENFLEKEISNNLEKTLLGNKFPWYFLEKSVELPDVFGFVNTALFRHSFILENNIVSNYCNLIDPILKKISSMFSNQIEVASVTANFLLPNSDLIGKYITPHYDVKYDSSVYEKYKTYTGLYYVNDSDADTIIFKEQYGDTITSYSEAERILPKKNKLVLWDSKIYHSAPATATRNRLVININFITNGSVAESGLLQQS